MQKTELKNLHFSMRYLENTKRQTPIGLHGEEGKSICSEYWTVVHCERHDEPLLVLKSA